jgi:hypothetical protein
MTNKEKNWLCFRKPSQRGGGEIGKRTKCKKKHEQTDKKYDDGLRGQTVKIKP